MQIKKCVCHTHFYGVFRGTRCLRWYAGQKHFVICVCWCFSTTRYIISTEYEICLLSTTLHKRDLFREVLIWLDAEEDVDRLLCICRQCACDMLFQVLICLVMIVWLSAAGLGGRGRLAEFVSVTSFAKAVAAYRFLK